MNQLETSRADDFLLPVTQHTMNGWTGITDAGVGVPDGQDVVAILHHKAEALLHFARRMVR